MSILQRRQKLQKLLFMLRHQQMWSATYAAKRLMCHPSTIEKLLLLLRKEGHVIVYDRILKKYRLISEEEIQHR